MGIIVIGSANMDMVMQTERLPEVGETIQGRRFFLSAGGKGANQAVASAKMGVTTHLMGKVGDDIFGQSLMDSLIEMGVKTDYIKSEKDVSTGVAAITVHNGNNSIILDGGANDKVTPEYIRSYSDVLLSASAIMMQLEIPLETVKETIRLVKGKVPIFLNPAPAVALSDDLLDGIDYFTPNEIECRLYTGVEINSSGDSFNIEDAFKALDILRDKGIKFPIITLGEKGVAYFNGEDNIHKLGRIVEAVDTTAAGDTFSGALAAMITSGKSLDEAVDIAQLASSIAVTRWGAQSAIPSIEEILAL